MGTHITDQAAGSNGVIEAHPALVVRVLPSGQDVLRAHVVGPLVKHPCPTLHPDGVAATEMGAEFGAIVAALKATTLEIFVLVKDDL